MEELRRWVLLAGATTDAGREGANHHRCPLRSHRESRSQNAHGTPRCFPPALHSFFQVDGEFDDGSVRVRWTQQRRLGEWYGIVRPCPVDHRARHDDDLTDTAFPCNVEEIRTDRAQNNESRNAVEAIQDKTVRTVHERGVELATGKRRLQAIHECIARRRHDHHPRHAKQANAT